MNVNRRGLEYIIDGSALQIWRAPGENQPQKFVGPK